MSGATRAWILVIVILAATVGGMIVMARDTRSDEEQIRTALQESIDMSREGRAGGVLDLLSSHFKIEGVFNLSPAAIAREIRENKPDLRFSNERLVVDGEKAEMTADIAVSGSVGMGPVSKDFSVPIQGVRLLFRKEGATRFIFIPTQAWKLTEVKLPAGFVPDFGF